MFHEFLRNETIQMWFSGVLWTAFYQSLAEWTGYFDELLMCGAVSVVSVSVQKMEELFMNLPNLSNHGFTLKLNGHTHTLTREGDTKNHQQKNYIEQECQHSQPSMSCQTRSTLNHRVLHSMVSHSTTSRIMTRC